MVMVKNIFKIINSSLVLKNANLESIQLISNYLNKFQNLFVGRVTDILTDRNSIN
jgi:hypothetical protein